MSRCPFSVGNDKHMSSWLGVGSTKSVRALSHLEICNTTGCQVG